MKKEFIFIGPPGSGKGTQTEILSKEYNLPHVDTGALLRKEIAEGSEIGIEANKFISQGKLVPLYVVKQVIKKRLLEQDCSNGFILDGYPRSIEQSVALDEIINEIDGNNKTDFMVFYFDISEEYLIERLVNRRYCQKCGKIWNIKTMKMKDTSKCDICASQLIQRKDDTEEIARARFDTYFSETAPLIDLYKNRNVLYTINALNDIKTVYNELKGVIENNVN